MVCCNLCESTRCNECNPPQSCKECYLADDRDGYRRDQMVSGMLVLLWVP